MESRAGIQIALHTDVLRLVMRSSPQTSAQLTGMLLLLMHITFILIWFFFGDTVALLRESYTFLYRRSYGSSMNLMKLKFLEFDE